MGIAAARVGLAGLGRRCCSGPTAHQKRCARLTLRVGSKADPGPPPPPAPLPPPQRTKSTRWLACAAAVRFDDSPDRHREQSILRGGICTPCAALTTGNKRPSHPLQPQPQTHSLAGLDQKTSTRVRVANTRRLQFPGWSFIPCSGLTSHEHSCQTSQTKAQRCAYPPP